MGTGLTELTVLTRLTVTRVNAVNPIIKVTPKKPATTKEFFFMIRFHQKPLCLLFIILFSTLPAAAETLSLPEAVQKALLHSPAILEARNLEKSSGEALKSSRADFLPKASASYSFSHLSDAPYQVVGGVQRQVGDTDNVHWDLTLVQPLFRGFGLVSRYKVARAESEIGTLRIEQTAKDLVRDVKTAYYEALLAESMEKVAEDQVLSLEAQERDAQRFYDHGVIPKNDLLKSKIARASAIQELERARAEVKLTLSRLSLAMGETVDREYRLVPVKQSTEDPGDLVQLMELSVKNRPEMKIMGKTLAAYDASITLARSAAWPEISLVGRYEQNGQDSLAEDNDYSNDHNTSVSLQARWTFFEWGKTRAETGRVRYDRQAFSQKIRAAEDRIRLETRQEYLNLGVREKNIRTAEEALEQARENFRITRSRYLQNVTTSTEVLEAQTFLSRAESDYHRSVYGYLIARARLDRATGNLSE